MPLRGGFTGAEPERIKKKKKGFHFKGKKTQKKKKVACDVIPGSGAGDISIFTCC